METELFIDSAAAASPVLAFDCATSPASVALKVGQRVISETIPHGKQAAQLVPVIDRLLRENHVEYHALECIVTTIGPGSFTGLRIALATLHGLVLAHPTPIRLLTASEAVAWAIALMPHAPKRFVVALDAGKGEVFAQEFMVDNARPIAAGNITTHAAAMVAAGELPCFSNRHAPDHPHYVSGPDAAVLARIAEHLPIASLSDAAPYYIRDADAKIPIKSSMMN